MDKLVIEYKAVSELIAYVNNPRNNELAIEKVAESIKEFGFKNPVIIDQNNVIIAGHTRLLAATSLGYEEVPTLKVSDLTPDQIRAFRITDNKVAEFSEWDESLLAAELEELKVTEYDLRLTGFDLSELNGLLSKSVKGVTAHEPINDEGLAPPVVFDYKMTIGKRKLILTEYEFNAINEKLDAYSEEHGVTFGFVRYLVDGES